MEPLKDGLSNLSGKILDALSQHGIDLKELNEKVTRKNSAKWYYRKLTYQII